MLVEAPLGNIFNRADSDLMAEVDWLDLTWQQCGQRAVRGRTRGGRVVRILLKLGVTLRHGDVLREADPTGPCVAVNVLPGEVLVARPRDRQALFALAVELGNLHAPTQLIDGMIVTVCDGPVEAVFDRLGVKFEVETRRFEPSFGPLTRVELADGFRLIAR